MKWRQHYVFCPGQYLNGTNPHFQQMILQRFAPSGSHVLHPCACCSQIRIWIFCYKCCTYIPFCNIAGYAQSTQYLMENLVHNLTQKKCVFMWFYHIYSKFSAKMNEIRYKYHCFPWQYFIFFKGSPVIENKIHEKKCRRKNVQHITIVYLKKGNFS